MHTTEQIHPWLHSKDSLTQRLRALTQNQIDHRLYYADWGHATSEECELLQLAPHTKIWLREMGWHYQKTLWVFGRTVIPESSLRGPSAMLKDIDKQSLGDVLFQDPTLKRKLFPCPTNPRQRCSLFYFHQQPLLVTELFLPPFFTFIEEHACVTIGN